MKERTTQFSRYAMRINPQDRVKWEQAAKKEGKSLAQWLKDLANDAS